MIEKKTQFKELRENESLLIRVGELVIIEKRFKKVMVNLEKTFNWKRQGFLKTGLISEEPGFVMGFFIGVIFYVFLTKCINKRFFQIRR